MEWLIGIIITLGIATHGQLFLYYKWSIKKIREVEKHVMTVRDNDLHHIDQKLDSLNDKIFELASRKEK